MPNVGREGPAKTHVQSVLFNKDKWTPVKAKTWLSSHKMKHDGMDETDKYLRYRQYNPDASRFSYRTETVGKGITFIYGFPKKTKGAEEDIEAHAAFWKEKIKEM